MDERPHTRELEVQRRGLERRLRSVDRGAIRKLRVDVGLELALRDRFLCRQWCIAFDIAVRSRELRFCLRELRLRLTHRVLERSRIDFEEHLTLPHLGALLIRAPNQVPGDLRTY